jgi:hypothetical protein
MALGKRKDGGNFLPIIKYDARVGTFYLQDRVNSGGAWQTEQRDVTENFQAAFDLENLQRGWIRCPKGAAPEVTLVPAGDDPGEPPTDDHKEGVRVVLKLADHLGGDVRELMSTARGLWIALDTLHDRYLASAADHAGQVPVITLDDIREVKTAGGATFVPTFKIADWIPRPPELAGAVQARPVEAQLAMPLSQPRPRRETVRRVPAAASTDIEDEIPF